MNDLWVGILLGFGAFVILGATVAGVYRFKNRTSSRVRMLAKQYRAMTDSAGRDISMATLSNPDSISSRMEFRKIEAIEAELINQTDGAVAQKLLKDFFKTDDPWIRARAAKALYPLDAKTAFAELASLVKDPSPYLQLPGVWALGELGTRHSVLLLMSMVWNKNPEVQQAVIRNLVQLDIKKRLPMEYQGKVTALLKEVRYKTDWIL